jgi:tetratricopeptide (TPR) repeat protein
MRRAVRAHRTFRAALLVLGALMVLLWSALGMIVPAAADQRDVRLDRLFERLQTTESGTEARAVQQEIWQIWIESDDMLSNRLMRNGMQAMASEQFPLALDYFDRLVEHAPDFAEGWNRRATLHYLMDNYPASVFDIERTLELEPRHFGALSGLGLIYDAIDEPAAALRSFEAALAINPHLEGTRQRIDALRRQLRGRPL